MPVAIDLARRRKLVQAYEQGHSYARLAQEFHLAYNTVRTLCIRYVRDGESGIVPRYGACGPQEVKHDPLIYRAACYLKRRHPKWGAALIRLHLEDRYPDRRIPAVRTMQTWFKRARLQAPRSQAPREEKKAPSGFTRSGKWTPKSNNAWLVGSACVG